MMSAGRRRHLVTLNAPGAAQPDGDGGYTQTMAPLFPAVWFVSIEPATARDLERAAAGTVIATASHIVTGPHHAGITTETEITFGSRTFHVVGVSNPEERNIDTIALCVEVVP